MKSISANICYFDLESSGLCTLTSKILQLAAISNKNKEIFQSYVMTPPNFEIKNSFIHNITNETLIKNDAPSFDIVMNNFIKFTNSIFGDEKLYMIAHNNYGYDMNLLESQCKEFNIAIPNNWRFYDSLYQFRKYNPEIGYGNYSLGKLFNSVIGEEPDGEFHNAITDVKSLMNIHEVLTCKKFKSNLSFHKELDNNSKISTANLNLENASLETIIHNYDKIIGLLNRKGYKTVSELYEVYKKVIAMNTSFEDYLEIMGITSKAAKSKITNQLRHIHNIKSD